LGLNTGETYGLANCDQAVEAGVIGIAVLLFVGSISMVCKIIKINRFYLLTRIIDLVCSHYR
jgi:hypothetical protein